MNEPANPRRVAILPLMAFLGMAVPAIHAKALVYDAAADFALTSNPNGVWSYGFETSLGATLQLYDTPNADSVFGEVPGLESWTYPPIDSALNLTPDVLHNATAADLSFSTVTIPPLGLSFHPGLQGEFSVIRWTAPSAGSYELAVAFRGNDFVGPTSTDVFVMHDDILLFSDGVYAYGPGPSFASAFPVQAGDTIDFVVGVGRDGNYSNDQTGIAAVITAIPEPATLTLTGLGLLCYGRAHR